MPQPEPDTDFDLGLYTARLTWEGESKVTHPLGEDDVFRPFEGMDAQGRWREAAADTRPKTIESPCDLYRTELTLKPEIARFIHHLPEMEQAQAERHMATLRKDLGKALARSVQNKIEQNTEAHLVDAPKESANRAWAATQSDYSGKDSAYHIAMPRMIISSEMLPSGENFDIRGYRLRLTPYATHQTLHESLQDLRKEAYGLGESWVGEKSEALRQSGIRPGDFTYSEFPEEHLHETDIPPVSLMDPIRHGTTGQMLQTAGKWMGKAALYGSTLLMPHAAPDMPPARWTEKTPPTTDAPRVKDPAHGVRRRIPPKTRNPAETHAEDYLRNASENVPNQGGGAGIP